MASSRVFVKNLPPTITEGQFKQHFATKGEVTDVKIIPKRRIGFVGYKTPEVAARAAKFYNRTYIGLCKLSVELAKPTTSVFPKSQSNTTPLPTDESHIHQTDTISRKRKREDEITVKTDRQHHDHVLPAAQQTQSTLEFGPPTKLQALDNKSDGYLPSKTIKLASYSTSPREVILEGTPGVILEHSAAPLPNYTGSPVPPQPGPVQEAIAPTITDDEWLRARTNRLLDLVDPEEVQPTITSGSKKVESEVQADSEGSLAQQPPPPEAGDEQEDVNDEVLNKIQQTSRLFVRNLLYSATEDDLRQHFSQFGTLEEVHLCVDRSGRSKGFAYLQFSDQASAVEAFQKSDGTIFQGRLLHILAGDAKRDLQLDEFAIAKLPLKQQNLLRQKSETTSVFRWNELYMNQDAVNASIAARKGISKADLLDHTSSDAAVKQAIAETEVIRDTKAYFIQNGVDLDAFKSKKRVDSTAILVKNFAHGTKVEELRTLFEPHGDIKRVLMPPSGAIAIVEFAHPSQAKVAYAKVAYQKFKDSLLFLEKAPRGLFKEMSAEMPKNGDYSAGVQSLTVADLLAADDEEAPEVETSSLYVKNLNFDTTSEALTNAFKNLAGFISARINTKPDPKQPGKSLSMGYGFVVFRSQELAQAALKSMDGYDLDNHKLSVRASHRGQDAAEERRQADAVSRKSMNQRKIIIKNLPFQITKKEIRALVGTYGTLRSLRVPKNFENRARGFAFAEFATPREAHNAFETLKDTHFLGRKLVLEWAEAEVVDAEQALAKMQQKAGSQLNKVTLQQLRGKGRQRFEMEGDEVAEDA